MFSKARDYKGNKSNDEFWFPALICRDCDKFKQCFQRYMCGLSVANGNCFQSNNVLKTSNGGLLQDLRK